MTRKCNICREPAVYITCETLTCLGMDINYYCREHGKDQPGAELLKNQPKPKRLSAEPDGCDSCIAPRVSAFLGQLPKPHFSIRHPFKSSSARRNWNSKRRLERIVNASNAGHP